MTLVTIFETCVRSAALAAVAGLVLVMFRVQSSSIKLAVWRMVVFGSLLMPLSSLEWRYPVPVRIPAPGPVIRAVSLAQAVVVAAPSTAPSPVSPAEAFLWQTVLLRGYTMVGGLLLLRAFIGLLRIRALARSGVQVATLGNDIIESPEVRVPVTCGLLERRILLPQDWREWSQDALDAVLAHERSHLTERDFLTQTLARVNCALQWCNPVAWWLHARLVSLAEEVSDDAALLHAAERPSYAALLLGFAGRGERLTSGVAMARKAPVAGRIERILDDTRVLSHPLRARGQAALGVGVFSAALFIGACRMTTVAAQTKPSPVTATGGGVTGGVSGGIQAGVSGGVSAQGVSGGLTGVRRSQSDSYGSSYSWNDSDRTGWALIDRGNGDSTNISGTGPTSRALMAGRNMTGAYAWYTAGGNDYLIDDPATVNTMRELLRPQLELGRQQGALGERQGALGEQMGKLGEEMGKLGEQMGSVRVDAPKLTTQLNELVAEVKRLELSKATMNDLGELQGKIGDLQSRIGDMQGHAGDQQAKISAQQAALGDKQAKLGDQQAKLGEEQERLGKLQERAAKEAEEKLRLLFQQAIKDGRAKPVQ